MPDIHRENGAKGGEAKASHLREEQRAVARQLPPLDSVENAMKRLELINDATVSGVLAGSVAGAAVRACEVWLKAHAQEVDARRLKELERQIASLEDELAAAKRADHVR